MLFSYAKGMLISDNGYKYRDGAPLKEYFYNTGKVLDEPDPEKRMEGMKSYFATVLDGYRSETNISDEELSKLHLIIASDNQ